ncbi:MGMT family protein [Citricoccus muralis]|uniref:MGMT family protein n=1 Tax=Citricoccus muralis TaxID=169134 RepID=A0ABY8H713_9MICC|nr:MGMT family protein [Citricoccus muralis]WFP16939.1 MGMT family protein [Citricoccus muralis]
MAREPSEEYTTAVLDLVAQIPKGRVMTYGLIAEIVAETLHRGGPRQVGHVLARGPGVDSSGATVPWWRVVNAAGSPPQHHRETALALLRDEKCPLTTDGQRVRVRRAVWFPELDVTTASSRPPRQG